MTKEDENTIWQDIAESKIWQMLSQAWTWILEPIGENNPSDPVPPYRWP
jgi:hypothetical protein